MENLVEDEDHLENWTYMKDLLEILVTKYQFNFSDFLEQQRVLQCWKQVFLGSNLARDIQKHKFEQSLQMIDILEIAARVEGAALHDGNNIKRLREAIESRS